MKLGLIIMMNTTLDNNFNRTAHHGGIYNVLVCCTGIVPCQTPGDVADVKD